MSEVGEYEVDVAWAFEHVANVGLDTGPGPPRTSGPDLQGPERSRALDEHGDQGLHPRQIITVSQFQYRPSRRARGASAYLVKCASLEELIAAVRSAARAQHGPPDGHAVMVIPRDALRHLDPKAGDLSGRELEILLLAARGMSYRQIISAAVHIAEATVERHLANFYAKLEVGSRSEVTRITIANGWISAREDSHDDRDIP